MEFTKDWSKEVTKGGKVIYRPILDLVLKEKETLTKYSFVVDSGADISLAPRYLAGRIGLDWAAGEKVVLKGISEKEICDVEGRIHEIDIIIPEIASKLRLPLCFAVGNVPFLLGREGLFDYFTVGFDKENKQTRFEIIHEDRR